MNNIKPTSPEKPPEPLPSAGKLVLRLTGLNHVPSFKNSKMLTRGRLITKPERQQWMEAATRLIESQLRSLLATEGIETQMVRSLLSSTALFGQFDDSVQWIPEIHIKVQRVTQQDEGAIITIERLT
jgi:hypothetical protein